MDMVNISANGFAFSVNDSSFEKYERVRILLSRLIISMLLKTKKYRAV